MNAKDLALSAALDAEAAAPRNFVERLRTLAEEQPDTVWLTVVDEPRGGRREVALTYAEFTRRVHALAARLQVSEAALYRHFASKAQMFEGLIEFIEQSVFALVAQIVEREVPDAPSSAEGAHRAARVVAMVLQFGERNPGMVRVMVGDALVLEHERLQQRMGQFFDRIESTLRQCLRGAAEAAGSSTPTVDAQVRAAALCDLVRGRLQRYARSGLRRPPTEHLNATLALMLH
ncbi:nucleoid occlusion factor SlmA [Paracidovorax cattleyae]|uniref:nucleoid occlusion factor SlmA n=1 Tax=Paracidovorax cattleyae TaxID=80868 RepID=UPI001E4683E2|nr:nucleoid occlusion factor SlmA [Paracidovorax cattleyae]